MKQIFLIGAILVILGIIAFVFINLGGPQISQPEREQVIPQPRPVSLPTTVYNLSGIIQSIGASSFVMEAKIPEGIEGNTILYSLEQKTIEVLPTTKITKITFVQEEGTNRKLVEETTIPFSALQQGNSIEVVSNKEVRTEGKIQATQIRILAGG